MGVTGRRFLELTKAEGLAISGHALRRLRERTGRRVSQEEAFELFLNARQVRAAEMITLGYRPAYGRRLRRGQKSWYFRLLVGGEEAIAVIGQTIGEEGYVWTTTYGRNAQTEHLCTATCDRLAGVA